MPDTLNPTQRSYCMPRIRGKDTKPEILVRKGLHARGFRFRLQDRGLPGRPDIVLPKYGVAIMVNGCFWHGHEGCGLFVMPKSRTEYWHAKIIRNQERDKRVKQKLASMGWHSITIWECQLKPSSRDMTLESLAYTLNRIFLQNHGAKGYDIPVQETTPKVAEDGTEYK